MALSFIYIKSIFSVNIFRFWFDTLLSTSLQSPMLLILLKNRMTLLLFPQNLYDTSNAHFELTCVLNHLTTKNGVSPLGISADSLKINSALIWKAWKFRFLFHSKAAQIVFTLLWWEKLMLGDGINSHLQWPVLLKLNYYLLEMM